MVISMIAISTFVALWTYITLRTVSMQPLLRKRNYLGEEVISSCGLAVVSSSILGWVLSYFLLGLDLSQVGLMSVGTFSYSVLGLFDDIMGESHIKGWRGHIKAFLTQKKLTTGSVKALVGGIFAFMLSYIWADDFIPVITSTLIIALSANAMNLLDVRPSRALKGFWLLTVIGVFVTKGYGWLTFLPVWVSTISYAPYDFRRKKMLGDAGSNSLGACFGIWTMIHWPLKAQIILAILWIAFHLYAERRSLTQDLAKLPALHWLDLLWVSKVGKER